MGGDYSRDSFSSLNDFAGVFLQQGHPILDSDINELVALDDRRLRAQTVDTIGRATVPSETPTGFQITPAAGPQLTIGRGRIYVDGMLAECHGLIDKDHASDFDRERVEGGKSVGVLDESISAAGNDAVSYMHQPYWLNPDELPTGGPHLAYLDVWRREVTALKDRKLLDPALNDIDTATRWQTVWQVRLLSDIGASATCGSQLEAWDALTAPSPARLTVDTVKFEDPDDPCLIPPSGGYRGLENQFYRVEIHVGGDLGEARFKWSRENASVGATIEAFIDPARIRVRRIGRDQVLRFETGDWVEVTDDLREFSGLSGDIRRVTVEPETNELRFDDPLSDDLVPPSGNTDDTPATRHSRVIKWDQSGKVLLSDGSVWTDLDDATSDGLIPVPADGRAIILEAGITVTFTSVDRMRPFRMLDYWSFAARTVPPWIDPIVEAPPRGIHHHYARLAVVTFPSTVIDCRTFWPPVFESTEECGCTVCVSVEDHNSGTLTIQQALSQLPPEGGTVCIGPGDFKLGNTPIVVSGRRSTRLKGHGAATQLAFIGQGNAAIEVSSATDVRISDLNIAAFALREANDDVAAILLRNVSGAAVERVGITAEALGNGEAIAIRLDGYQLDTVVDSCVLAGTTGIGAASDDDAGFVALLETRISETTIIASRRGISLDGRIFHLGAVQIERNVISAREAGVVATGLAGEKGEWSTAALRIDGNAINLAPGCDGIVSSVPDSRISDNEIIGVPGGGSDRRSNGIVLPASRLPEPKADVQIVGNRIGRLSGHGILVGGALATLIAKRNVIRDCGMGGLVMMPEASADLVAFENNHVERVGLADTADGQAGVRLVLTTSARVIGNEVITVGPDERSTSRADYWAGIEFRGISSAEVAENLVTNIGGGQREGFAYGILVFGPVGSVALESNEISDPSEIVSDDAVNWSALVVSERDMFSGRTGGNLTYVPALLERNSRLFALSHLGIREMRARSLRQLAIGNNRITDGHLRSRLPLVLAMSPIEIRASLRFSGNQVRSLSPEGGSALVHLRAFQVIASHNSVRRENDLEALAIECAGGRTPNGLAIGNITYGPISINGNSVPPPFDALNLSG